MQPKRITPKNLRTVLTRLADAADRDKAFGKQISHELNIFLDDLSNNDFFGTEGQLDPRSDRRD